MPFSCPFPLSSGREPVRQWLGILDRKLDRIEGSLNHTEYNDMIEWSSNDSYLPKKQEYLGCKGKSLFLFSFSTHIHTNTQTRCSEACCVKLF